MEKLYVIAELCCNHMGSMDTAKAMIDLFAQRSGDERIDIVKFQKRTPKLMLTPEQYNAPHPHPENSYGKTYGEHREFLEFSVNQHRELKQYCEDNGLTYSSSVFDSQALEDILSLNPKMIKFGASNNTDLKLLRYLAKNFNGEIHMSLGCITREEEKGIIKAIGDKLGDTVLYACTSAYPPPVGQICLLEISRLKNLYGKYAKAIGFSGHHLGIYHDIAALALGATYFERHFTLDKNNKGTDHKISLEIDEISELARVLRTVEKDLVYKPDGILECETYVRKTLKQITSLDE